MSLTSHQPNIFSNSTWTMAIASQTSPLSRWWGQTLERVSEFSLRFSPPKDEVESDSAESQTLVLKGDAAQLEALSQLTEAYIQTLLVQSVITGTTTSQENPIATLAEDDPAFPDDMPEWQADSGYCHRLYLGSLQVEPLVSELRVTTTQLHDLSEILQEALPSAHAQSARAFPMRSSAWPKTAAAAAVAIGLTGGVAWYVTGGSPLQTASEPEQEVISLDPGQPLSSPSNGIDLPPNFEAQPAPPKASSPQSPTVEDLPETRKPNVVVPTAPNTASSASGQKPPDTPQNAEPNPSTANNTSQRSVTVPSNSQQQTVTQQAASTPQKKTAREASPAPNTALEDKDPPNALARLNEGASSDVASESDSADNAAPSEPAAAEPQSAAAPPPVEAVTAANQANPSPSLAPPSVATESVLTFFQSQWQGQDSLSQSLSYRIEVKPDGTVSTVTPKNNLASVQIEQTPVPPAGARVTPPFNSPNPVSFDVTLYPDGTVSVK